MAQDVIGSIVEQNLGVYRVAPSRLLEDVTQEAQVASDYRGRLAYELLQNADDAMEGDGATDDRVSFLVTDEALWVANSGRPLSDSDVEGLCGLGASSKVDAQGVRRASIGHKGLGFKSVLEITDEPRAYSLNHSLALGSRHAIGPVSDLLESLGRQAPKAVPAMRFPVRLEATPQQWDEFKTAGLRTAFEFPFRSSFDSEQRAALGDLLLGLPLTTVLFLKHLEHVEVVVDRADTRRRHVWNVKRERLSESGSWIATSGLTQSGLYRVSVAADDLEETSFLVALDADVHIGANRDGLSGLAWEGVDITEVSVAVLANGEAGNVPSEWRHFHVFLPTDEACPYPMLINGAFVTDLARKHLRAADRAGDYNRHLVAEAARLFREQIVPRLLEDGPDAVLRVLDRDGREPAPEVGVADLLHACLKDELSDLEFLETESGGAISLGGAVFPTSVLGESGEDYRTLLPTEATWEGRTFPAATHCRGSWARIASDHGALELSPSESVRVLAFCADPVRSRLQEHPSGGFEVDPVLEICTTLWEKAEGSDRVLIEEQAKAGPLFPTQKLEDGTVNRVAVHDSTAFYPPRSARHDLPLRGLQFMCHSICWGALLPRERNEFLEGRMRSWSALFDVKEFRFEAVMSAAVIPALVLSPGEEAQQRLEGLRNLGTIASICQLAGAFAKPDRPLRYQRLQSDRALFNLSRLPLPCRSHDSETRWVPAYRVYFGSDWIGERSIEHVLDAIPQDQRVDIHLEFLVPPEEFLGLLPDFDTTSDDEAPQDDEEVGVDEDTDRALETDERQRWLSFLAWIGVNEALRPIHFHDVEDRDTGWLTTRGLEMPKGWAFQSLGGTWDGFKDSVDVKLRSMPNRDDVVPYLYEVHDLDQIIPLMTAAESDPTSEVAGRLFEHLAMHWGFLSAFADAELALVQRDKWPNARTKPPRARSDELHTVHDNLWLYRIRQRAFCPTTHGPQRPELAWQSSAEVDRRFGAGVRNAGDFVPVLDLNADIPPHHVRSLAQRLGVRADLTPSAFTLEDAALVCRRIAVLFGGVDITTNVLGKQIRPVYRQVFELLSGRSQSEGNRGALSEVPLLAHTPRGLEFRPARGLLYASTPGVTERTGVARRLETFVIEADPSATAPLTGIFGVRNLEDVLDWQSDPGEPSFDDEELELFRSNMRSLTVPLLARIRAERSNPRDRTALTQFIESVEPVEDLRLTCTLDGQALDDLTDRPYFIRKGSRSTPMQAFVVWNGAPWPPDPDAAQALAMALADATGMNLVETFLAFIQSSPDQRIRLLEIAGAASLIEEVLEELNDTERDDGIEGSPSPEESRTTIATERSNWVEEQPAQQPAPSPPPARVPLVRFQDLRMDGVPIVLAGEAPLGEPSERRPSGSKDGQGSTASSAPAGLDLGELDELGMRIAMAYEVRRLRRAGVDPVIIAGSPEPTTAPHLVVDVHDPAAIRAAEELAPAVRDVLSHLESRGISRIYPGFDILTIYGAHADRLIELKSSGIDARIQTMTWNEWKSARSSELRSTFWLYLVGNLRADLLNANPYVRGIQDPFGSLMSEMITERSIRRAVQLRVREFEQAEHLDLELKATPDVEDSPEDSP